MTDLGFGLADRRSVFAVVFALAAACLATGNPLPVDGSSAAAFLLSVLSLLGFLIGARMLSRLVLVVVYFVLRLPFDLASAGRLPDQLPWEDLSAGPAAPDRASAGSSLPLGRRFSRGVSHALRWGVLVPLLIEQDWEWRYGGYLLALGVLGVCDRLALVAIAFIATLPSLAAVRGPVALAGIIILLAAYVVTGRFTVFLKDAVHKSETDQP
jgi:hypothetical protein